MPVMSKIFCNFAPKFYDIMDLEKSFQSSYDLLKAVILIPSVTRDEEAVADFLQDYLMKASGEPVRRHINNLWQVAPGYDGKRPTLLLNAHCDTVRPVDSWKHEPFTPIEENGCLYGLGSNDDGASLVTLLHTYLALREVPQSYNLVFAISAEEEVSGKNGLESILPLMPQIDVALVGEPTGMRGAVAEKGLVVLDGTAHGKAGHAARGEGINALYIALDAIAKLRDYTFPKESATLGPVRITTTQIQAGTAHNVVPDVCTFVTDVRTTDAYSNQQVVEILRQLVAPVELKARSTRLEPSSIAESHPLVRKAASLGISFFGSPTLSDQSLMRWPSLKMGPGDSARSHTADEFIRKEEIRDALRIYWQLLNGLNLQKPSNREIVQ